MFVTYNKGSRVLGTVVMEDAALGQCGQHRELYVPSAILCRELKAVLSTSMNKGKEKCRILDKEKGNILDKVAKSVQCAGDVN